MKICIVFPNLPPAVDGIGDHTALLARALAAREAEVVLLTARRDGPVGSPVAVRQAFELGRPGGLAGLAHAVAEVRPHWVLLQYNPFSYGRWGLNLELPRVFAGLRRRVPGVRLALMVHEPFTPLTSLPFAVMTIWQRYQLWRLGRASDVVLVSIQRWAERFRRWFRGRPVVHLPVGSNVPDLGLSRVVARSRLGLAGDMPVFGLFGSAHPSRLVPYVGAAARAVARRTGRAGVLYVGTAGTQVARGLVGGQHLEDVPASDDGPEGPGAPGVAGRARRSGEVHLMDAGPQPPEGVSLHLSAVDVYLAPYEDGVSTRRGAFMAGIQHGLPCLTTLGPNTDDLLRSEAGRAFLATPVGSPRRFAEAAVLLATRPDLREALGQGGRELFAAHFAWDHLARRLLDTLEAAGEELPPGRRTWAEPAEEARPGGRRPVARRAVGGGPE